MWIPELLTSILALTPQSPVHSSKSYPKHQVFKLNDGHSIPSPAYGVGTAWFGQDAAGGVSLALSQGYLHIDNARVYGNEASVGKALSNTTIPRKDLYITSKYDALNGSSVEVEIEQTLSDLNLTYLDLYLIHFPRAADAGGGIAKVWSSFEKLKKDGVVKSIGVSNYNVEQLTELLEIAEIKPAVNQIRYHAYNALENTALLALCAANGIIVEAYSSLTPITRSPGGPADSTGTKIASHLSQKYGSPITVAQMILDWLRTKGIVAVTTSNKEYRLKEQLEVFGEEFPKLSGKEVGEYELAGPGWEPKN